jgi:predicted nuclease with TOPRIM domain
MAKTKAAGLFEVTCPCCQAALQIDPQTRAVITFKAHEKPRELADIDSGLERLKGEAARREEAFRKSFEAERNSQQVLARKFDELFKKAKETADEPPPKRDIDLD